jgi:hypothetical protein
MVNKSKGLIITLVLFIVMLVFDLISTLIMGDLIKYLEANPIYSKIGLAGIFLINLFIVLGVYYFYMISNNPLYRFISLNFLVTILITRIIIVINNIQIYLSSPTVEMAMSVTPEMKAATITKFFFVATIPYIIGTITYLLFQIDHNIEIKRVYK